MTYGDILPKVKKHEIIRITKIDYYPSQYDKDAYTKELITIIYGVNKRSQKVRLLVHGCVPRFWVDVNPKSISIPSELSQYITVVKREGLSFIDKKKLWCIYLKYPYGKIIRPLRELFPRTYQADVIFAEAVRVFYDFKSYIQIPAGRSELHIKDIKGVDTPKNPIKTNTYVFDIETSDSRGFGSPENPTAEVRNFNLLGSYTNVDHHCISKQIDEQKVLDNLSDGEWLKSHIDHDVIDIEPFTGEVKHYNVNGEAEAKERRLFDVFVDLIDRIGVTTIQEYAKYDTPYLIQRAKVKNKAIAKWNAKHNGAREYYPNVEKVLRSVCVVDIEEMYKDFISGSATASGRNALEWMGQKEMKYGKIKRGKIDEMYHDDPELLTAYNIWDCILPDRCMKNVGELIDIHEGVCDNMGCSVENWRMPMLYWEYGIMHQLKNKEILPSVKDVTRDEGMEGGGNVEGYSSGMWDYVIELDNSGEYNAVVMTLNIDHNTLVKNPEDAEGHKLATAPSGRQYMLDVEGVIPEMLKEMNGEIDEYKAQIKTAQKYQEELFENPDENKDEIKRLTDMIEILDRQKYILKACTLSSTGLYGTAKIDPKKGKATRPFRLGHGGMGSDVTEIGREHRRWNKEFIESHPCYYSSDGDNWKFKMELDKENIWQSATEFPDNIIVLTEVAGDTDSSKCISRSPLPDLEDMEMLKFLTELGNYYSDELNKSFDKFARTRLGVDKHYFRIKLDYVFRKYFQWGSKKHYCYKRFDGKIKWKGIKLRRRDAYPVEKEFLEKLIYIVMSDYEKDEIINQLSDLINEYETNILGGKYVIECGKPMGVHEPTLNYESMLHSNAIFEKRFKLDDVAVFFPARSVDGYNLPKNKMIALEYGDDPRSFGVEIDYKRIIDKIKHSRTIEKIINAIEPGLNWDGIKNRIRITTIDEDDDIW